MCTVKCKAQISMKVHFYSGVVLHTHKTLWACKWEKDCYELIHWQSVNTIVHYVTTSKDKSAVQHTVWFISTSQYASVLKLYSSVQPVGKNELDLSTKLKTTLSNGNAVHKCCVKWGQTNLTMQGLMLFYAVHWFESKGQA